MTVLSDYLELYLEPLLPYLENEAVTDIYLNPPRDFWVEYRGGNAEKIDLPHWQEEDSWRLARQVARNSGKAIGRSSPILSARLPDGTRVQIVTPPACEGGVAMAFRRHLSAAPDLESYRVATDGASDDVPHVPQGDGAETHAYLRRAVQDRKTIVVSGGTSTGKTTLLNSLIAEIPRDERLVAIEDAPELRLPHENKLGLIASRDDAYASVSGPIPLLEATLRLRPSRIILGELRGAEAFAFLRASNTGHRGSMTSVHADSPEQAIDQIALMTQQAGMGLRFNEARDLARTLIDVVVQLERRNGTRAISRIEGFR
ncbi:MAG: P-type DNA transfer ATPase VirB11 [Sphingomonadales bacterium]|nr:P-type DNA transfer ATPase VirB11 [Sphingomonadales bacterium]